MSAMALGLLATFRVNASYDRFVEARTHWGAIINTSRDLIRQTLRWVPTEDQDGEDDGSRRERIVRLTKSPVVILQRTFVD